MKPIPALLMMLVLGIGRDIMGDYVTAPLRIGAWNLQRLGKTKMGKPDVVNIIVEVMRRYDIIVVLEVVDVSGETPILLLNALNNGLTDTYNLTISARLGRTSYKEQYAFYWKTSRVTAVSTFQYNDDVQDVFQFEPLIVVFEGEIDARLPKFGLAAIHAKPGDAVAEVDALVDVYDSFKTNTSIQDVMILGDFNAGCTYVGTNDYANIRLWTDPRFSWLVSDHIDTTTVAGTTCPYDRIVVAGNNLLAVTYKNTGGPYYFDEQLGITDDELVDDVSDHYPIEVLVRGAVAEATEGVAAPNVWLSVSISTSASSTAITTLSESLSTGQESCSSSQDLVKVTWIVNSIAYALESLTTFSDSHLDVVPREAVSVLAYKVNNGGLQDSTLHGEGTPSAEYHITLECQKSQALCAISLATRTSIN